MNPTEFVDWLMVHVYDPKINYGRNDLIPLDLKLIEQYLEALHVLFNIFPIKTICNKYNSSYCRFSWISVYTISYYSKVKRK